MSPCVAIGAPLGLSSTVTSGIISALNRPVTTGSTADDSSYINAIQTDAAINPGNSGGPLVNLQGQVVGVNSAIATNGGGSFDDEAGNIGVGFAIPVEQVITTADQILESGEAQYPVIGARVQTGGPAEFDGATVDEVLDDSPAQDAGLENGDLITHVNGVRVTDGIGLIVAIRTHQPGDTIEFTVDPRRRRTDDRGHPRRRGRLAAARLGLSAARSRRRGAPRRTPRSPCTALDVFLELLRARPATGRGHRS